MPLRIKTRNIDELNPYENNARIHSEDQVKQIAKSIESFGMNAPILIDADDGIIAGHGRVMALKYLGETTAPTITLAHLTEAQKQAYILADNKLAENAYWDDQLLSLELDNLINVHDIDIDAIGFSQDEIDALFQPEKKEGKTDPDQVPEPPEKPITKSGDVWLLGKHRVMCGDATNEDHMNTLMNGTTANILFTSPPYNAGQNVYDQTQKTTDGKYQEYDDDVDEGEWKALVNDSISMWRQSAQYQFYNIQQLAGNKRAFWEFVNDNVEYLADVAIWDKGKTAPAYPRNVMNSSFEFVLIFSHKRKATRAIATADFRGTVSNVLNMPRNEQNQFSHLHAATFPVSFPEYFIANFTQINGVIADCFIGCGTTLIACERLDRICCGPDIDPTYIDVTVKRWQDYTGEQARHIDGHLFDDAGK